MKSLIFIAIVIVMIMYFIPSKESFYGKPIYSKLLYPGVHNYHKDSYKHGLHGTKKMSYTPQLHFSNYKNFVREVIPIVDHLIL